MDTIPKSVLTKVAEEKPFWIYKGSDSIDDRWQIHWICHKLSVIPKTLIWKGIWAVLWQM